ncbi:MAG TPA: hypothetical protein VMR70_20580 [Flavisolibacter sp.]|nr:hypothetical protein [Flavisolibacter sp.]
MKYCCFLLACCLLACTPRNDKASFQEMEVLFLRQQVQTLQARVDSLVVALTKKETKMGPHSTTAKKKSRRVSAKTALPLASSVNHNWQSTSTNTPSYPRSREQQTYAVRTGAICCDGTRSYATGRGACSHHGGVREWLYE